jgi:hypothetical protein
MELKSSREGRRVPANKFLQSDQIVLSCLLQKAQKSRQHALAAEERRWADDSTRWGGGP